MGLSLLSLPESSLSATIHSTSFGFILSLAPYPLTRQALSRDPQLPLNHEVGPETLQVHLVPFNLGIAPSSQPRGPQHSQGALGPAKRCTTSSLPTFSSPPLPRLPQASLACNDWNS